jgi:hypothetical protein
MRRPVSRPVDPIVEARQRGKYAGSDAASSKQRQRARPYRGPRGPPADDDDDDVDAYSIAAFCRRHGISEAFYFKLRQQGQGPREMRLGSRVLISREEAARWRRARSTAA